MKSIKDNQMRLTRRIKAVVGGLRHYEADLVTSRETRPCVQQKPASSKGHRLNRLGELSLGDFETKLQSIWVFDQVKRFFFLIRKYI